MSAPPSSPGEPITDSRQLAAWLAAGSKPRSAWRIGTEHEKFVFRTSDHTTPSHEGPDGIGALLIGLLRFGWEPVREGDAVIALTRGGCNITLEPGGQFELSGAPVLTLHDTCAEVHEHLRQVKVVGDELGLGMLGLGFHPTARRADIPWMPKGRYRIMGRYMPTRGSLGLDMMLRTCTVQTNLDFADEVDMVRKFRVSLALQPIATALFANSPFTEGRPNGFHSFRSQVWTDTDPDRCGDLPFVFEDGFGFERYVDWMLDVPMYFVYREGRYLDVAGQSFRAFLERRLPGLPGEAPLLTDWTDHVTTAFPEVRLKRYLEMRGADGGPWRRLCALPALWVGLLYDDDALAAAWDLVRGWSAEERALLRRTVPRHGLEARLVGPGFGGRSVGDLAREVVEIARQGLRRRAVALGLIDEETAFLDPLVEIAASGRTPAAELLALYHGDWGGSVEPVFKTCAY